jgi:glutathione synthase/RimK-type ligase-like ATP-grasp enzyme
LRPTIALATCCRLPDLHPDDRLLATALDEVGFACRPLVWDSSEQDLAGVSAVIIRSCWDYHLHPEQFLAWAEGLAGRGVQLLNPAATLRWNHDKRYLRELQSRGVAIPQTAWFEPGSSAILQRVLEDRGWDKAVLKPAVSATAWNTFVVTVDSAPCLQSKFDEVLASGAAMVQRFIQEVITAGEWSFVFFDRQFSHAILKRPQNGDFRVQTEFGGTIDWKIQPSPALIEQASTILDRVTVSWLYARVDAIEVAGHLCLGELELIEPALFLDASSAAAALFARAVATAVNS